MATRSEVDICNLALGRIGAKPIVSLDADSTEARVCHDEYPAQRDFLLRKFAWKFAVSRASLPADPTAPAWGYAYSYELPADLSRLLQVGEYVAATGYDHYAPDPQADYVVEGRSLLTDREAPLRIRYVRTVTATEYFDDSFAECLIAHLAAALVMPITQKYQLMGVLEAKAYQTLINAARINALEQAPVQMPTPPALMNRL